MRMVHGDGEEPENCLYGTSLTPFVPSYNISLVRAFNHNTIATILLYVYI
jgi:hypothetical protein